MSNTVEMLASAHNWNLPTKCPICGGSLSITENHTRISCDNEACKSKLIGRLKKWVEKMNIMELAPVTLEKFIDAGFVNGVSDLYHLPYDKIANMDGFGKRSAEIYRKNIEAVKSVKLAQFISGFNITDVGEKVVQRIIDNILAQNSTIEELTVMDLIKMDRTQFVCTGVGAVTAQKFAEGLDALKADMMDTMDYVEVIPEKQKVADGILAGMSFCFTGKAEAIGSRSLCESLVIENGGSVASSVKKGLTYLVTDDTESGSSKNKKAKELGIPVITSFKFKEMIEND